MAVAVNTVALKMLLLRRNAAVPGLVKRMSCMMMSPMHNHSIVRHPFRRNLSILATSGSEYPESPLMESMKNKIKENLHAETVVVKDVSGDGRHVCIEVISSAFEGQSAVNRQRMVYRAIWEELQDRVHAVDNMITHTPSEAQP